MKKKLICLGVLLLALTACGQKKHGKTDSSSVQKSNSAKIESFNKENRNLLEKAEEQQVFTKHFHRNRSFHTGSCFLHIIGNRL